MVWNDFLEQLKADTVKLFEEKRLPVKRQKEDDGDPEPRAPAVYLTRIPDGKSAYKKAPYILHQIVTTKDVQTEGDYPESSVLVRSIFAVYDNDEQEGGLLLLSLMDEQRIHWLKDRIIADRYELDAEASIEGLVYQEDIAPYFAGEMITTWKVPTVKREVKSKWL